MPARPAANRRIPTLVVEDELPPSAPLPPSGGDNSLLVLAQWLADPLHGVREESRATLRVLVDEGRRFATTPRGRRWIARLSDSALVTKGALLWSCAGLDLVLTGADSGPGSPAALIEDLLQRVAAADVEAYLSQLSSLASVLAAEEALPAQ